MEKYHFVGCKKKKIIKEFGLSENLLETLKFFSKFESDDEDEIEDVQYEYIDLVFPPNSTPPTRNSIKKINLADFNQIHKMIC